MNPQQDACSGLGSRDARTSATPNLPAQLPLSITPRFIQNLSGVEYPEDIKSPKTEFNANVTNGRFIYDRDFLMQFMHICKEKPPTLPPLDVLGIIPIDPSFAMIRGSHGRHRNPSTAMVPSANRQASMGILQSAGSKLTSEERLALSSGVLSASSNATGNGGKRTRSKRGAKHGGSDKTTPSKQGQESAFESSCIAPLGTDLEPVAPIEMFANNLITPSTMREGQLEVDSPEMAEREIKALLDKLTIDGFDSISDQIIEWANRSVDEKDGRTLIQVIRLVFEKAADEAACSEMYARLCRKMMEQISPDVQDDGIKDPQGKPILGGKLFRTHFIKRCREDFQRGWFRKQPTNAANEEKGIGKADVYSDESYAAQIAKRRCLGLVKFIGELFMLQMLAEHIMHEFVGKLLANIQKEAQIETLCQLFKTVGQLLDTPKARVRMDVYFARMRELGKSDNVSARMQSMLQDVIELRERRWGSCDAVVAHATIAAVHEATATDITAAEKVSYNCQTSMSRGGSQRDGECNREFGPDGWAAQAVQFHGHLNLKAGDLSQFGKISKGAPMVMGSSSVFVGGTKDSNRESWSGKSSSSNISHMLSRNPVLTPESSSADIDLAQAGVPEPPVQRKKLQLLPRPKLTAEENTDIDLGQAGVPEPPVRRKKLLLLPRPKPTAEENTTAPSLDQNPEALALRKKLQLLPRFKPSAGDRVPADIK